jgi:hypothetical protein
MQELNWDIDNENNLEFPAHYWDYIEKLFSQFSTGEHIVTKAFDSENDYLGFTDDYDFCWGPENEGESLEITHTSYNEFTQRLWGVYQQTAGEIYLVKANEDITSWERDEQVIFAPSGSQKPTISFNTNGRYEIAVELTPAGSDTAEIWLMSYPYEDDNIRKICDGTEPQLFMNFEHDLMLFYTDNEQHRIYYRLMSESWNTEHEISSVYESDRQLHLRYTYKTFKLTGMNIEEEYGYVIVFYKRDDDYKPIKYILSDAREIFPYIIYEESMEPSVSLNNMSWLKVVVAKLRKTESMENPEVNLDAIEWTYVGTIEINKGEVMDNPSVGVDAIEWIEITSEDLYKEEFMNNPEVSIDSILWVEV